MHFEQGRSIDGDGGSDKPRPRLWPSSRGASFATKDLLLAQPSTAENFWSAVALPPLFPSRPRHKRIQREAPPKTVPPTPHQPRRGGIASAARKGRERKNAFRPLTFRAAFSREHSSSPSTIARAQRHRCQTTGVDEYVHLIAQTAVHRYPAEPPSASYVPFEVIRPPGGLPGGGSVSDYRVNQGTDWKSVGLLMNCS